LGFIFDVFDKNSPIVMDSKIEQLIGKFIIHFGSIETNIRLCIISIPILKDKNNSPNHYQLIRETLILNDTLRSNLDVLSKIVSIFVEKDFQKQWLEIINKVKEISEVRNLLVHGSLYEEHAEFYKIKKLKFDNPIHISQEVLEEKISLLKDLENLLDEFNIFYCSEMSDEFIYSYDKTIPYKLMVTSTDIR